MRCNGFLNESTKFQHVARMPSPPRERTWKGEVFLGARAWVLEIILGERPQNPIVLFAGLVQRCRRQRSILVASTCPLLSSEL